MQNREAFGIAELSGPEPDEDGDTSEATASHFHFLLFFYFLSTLGRADGKVRAIAVR